MPRDETPHDREVYARMQSNFSPRTYRGSPQGADRSDSDEARDIWRSEHPIPSRYYDPGGRDVRSFRESVRDDLRMARGNVRNLLRTGSRSRRWSR